MLRDAYRTYLSAGAGPDAARSFARALLPTPLASSATLLDRYGRDGAGLYSIATGTFAGERAFAGPDLPTGAEPGALWFDVIDLSTSILLPAHVPDGELAQLSDEARARAERNTCWFALQPVAAFQLAAALDAPCTDELAAAVVDDPTRYLTWAGKYLADPATWRAAQAYLDPAPALVPGEVRAIVPTVWGLRPRLAR